MGCHSLVLTVILMAGFCQDAMGKRPAMLPDKEAVLIEEFDEIRIECNSDGAKLRFSFPETTFMVPRSQHEILPPENGTYTFLREQAQFSDAGWYACAEENVVIDNDFWTLNHTNEHISWIYVYVRNNIDRFPDTGLHPFPKTVIVVPGSTIVVPCQVTSPNAYVELWQNFKRLEGYAADFDPRIGFVLKDIVFEAGEAIIQCTTFVSRDDYIFKLSGPKPTMITAHDQDLILQEGNELKIICHSETGVSFLFPNMTAGNAYLQSIYEISMDKNGTSTFLRPSVVSEDTGWYGCAGEGIQNDIPYHSINYTKNAIDWIYVYVNSSISMTSGSMVHRETFIQLVDSLIPCRPTSPEIQIHLHRWNPPFQRDIQFAKIFGQVKFDLKVTAPLDNIPFDPKVGFLVRTIDGWSWSLDVKPEFYCTTDHSVDYVSKNYSIGRAVDMLSKYPRPTIMDADDSLASDVLIIRFTGEKLRMLCAAVAPDVTLLRLEWTIPSTLLDDPRVKYDLTHAGSRFEDSVYLKGKQSMMTFTNMTETDGGEFMCLAQTTASTERVFATTKVSRHVLVFDKDGGNYIKLNDKGGELQLIGMRGEMVRWLVDLEDFPSTKIEWYDPRGHAVNVSHTANNSRHEKATLRHGAPQKLFIMRHLTFEDSGVYLLRANLGNATALINVTLDVQELPTASIQELNKYSYTRRERASAVCRGKGSPLKNLTISFLNCPKFPSQEKSTRVHIDKTPLDVPPVVILEGEGKSIFFRFDINVSGILICEACTVASCNADRKPLFYSDSKEPDFTSTNLNQSQVTWNLETNKNKTMTLECYTAGDPYPDVSWYKDNITLEADRQFKFKYDNRSLRIMYFLIGDSGRYMCRAENKHGTKKAYIDITVEGETDYSQLKVSLGAAVLIVVIATSWVVIWKQHIKASKKKLIDTAFKDGALRSFNPELSVVDQAELLPYDHKWEFPRKLLALDKVLGSGAFGIVRKAEAKSICRGEAVTTVAVKLVRSTARLNFMTALSRELKILVYLGKHPNVVSLLGACTRNVSYGELFVIVEFCRFGNLRDYLLHRRPDFFNHIRSKTKGTVSANADADEIQIDSTDETSNDGISMEGCGQRTDCTSNDSLTDDEHATGENSDHTLDLRIKYRGDYTDLNLEEISTRDLVYWSWQVSRGMEFLGTRKVVHGDLAARNVLLADNNIVKICDFGLSKALYDEAQYRDEGEDPLPLKWMAIESIKDRVFSYQSDIWSFGVVMWELFSLAETPYHSIRHKELHQKLIDGHRLNHPKYATNTIYEMMLSCWESDPSKRPSFSELAHSIGDMLDEGFKTQYLEMISPYMEMDTKIFENGQIDYLTLPPSAFDAAFSSGADEGIKMKHLRRDESESQV